MSLNSQTYALILIVLIILGSALNFIVYDEEIFLLMDFGLFLAFAYKMFGDSVADELDSKVSQIQKEFEALQELKIQKYEKLLQIHTIRCSISSELTELFQWTEVQLQEVSELCTKSLEDDLINTIEKDLKFLPLLTKFHMDVRLTDMTDNIHYFLSRILLMYWKFNDHTDFERDTKIFFQASKTYQWISSDSNTTKEFEQLAILRSLLQEKDTRKILIQHIL